MTIPSLALHRSLPSPGNLGGYRSRHNGTDRYGATIRRGSVFSLHHTCVIGLVGNHYQRRLRDQGGIGDQCTPATAALPMQKRSTAFHPSTELPASNGCGDYLYVCERYAVSEVSLSTSVCAHVRHV